MSASYPEPVTPGANAHSSSTTWAWRRVKLPSLGTSPGGQPPQATFWRRLSRRDPRVPLEITIKYRGGPEAWVEVKGRGAVGRYPGVTSVYDIVVDLNNCGR